MLHDLVEPALSSASQPRPAFAFCRLMSTLLGMVLAIAVGASIPARLAPRIPPARHVDEPRSPTVLAFSEDLASIPRHVSAEPVVILLGDSHLFLFPGNRTSEWFTSDAGGDTVVDYLSQQTRQNRSQYRGVTFLRLGLYGFAPLEMLIATEYLAWQGYRPLVVILGLRWEAFVNDWWGPVRPAIAELLRKEPGFVRALIHSLKRPVVNASPQIVQTLEDLAQLKPQQARSSADVAEDALLRTVGEYVPLVKKRGDLRARVLGFLTDSIVRINQTRGAVPVAPTSGGIRELHLHGFEALMRLLQSSGRGVFAYWAPELTSGTPFFSQGARQWKAPIIEAATASATQLRVPLLDARSAVPEELGGWCGDIRDRWHFSARGHKHLASYLFAGIEAHHAWPQVSR